MTDTNHAAKKVASILEFIEQPLTEGQKRAMPHVLTLACPHTTGDSAYWPDDEDPLAQVHGREKIKKLEQRCLALAYLVAARRPLSEESLAQMKRIEAHGYQLHGKAWDDLVNDAGFYLDRVERTSLERKR